MYIMRFVAKPQFRLFCSPCSNLLHSTLPTRAQSSGMLTMLLLRTMCKTWAASKNGWCVCILAELHPHMVQEHC